MAFSSSLPYNAFAKVKVLFFCTARVLKDATVKHGTC